MTAPSPPPAQAASTLSTDGTDRLLRGALLALYLLVVLRTAWMSDDAFITLRTVDNFVHGHGLTWNTFERVQAYTHPLWMFLLSVPYFLTREAFFTTILVSAGVSFAAARLVGLQIAPTARQGILALLILLFSRSFVDFSTSGLENPLLFLLLALFVRQGAVTTPRRLTTLVTLAGLLLLTRIDTILLVGPALFVALRQVPWRAAIRPLAVGLAPFAAWELFSLVYYGFPFPNTAYAKLAHQIPAGDLLEQGLVYFLHQLSHDPLSLAAIVTAILAPFVLRARAVQPLALGLVLYLLYIFKIGGDFMSGRFFAAPLLLAVAILARLDLRLPAHGVLGVGGLIALLGLGVRQPTITSDQDFGEARDGLFDRGVADERAFYFPHSGLLRYERGRKMPRHPWLSSAKYMAKHPETVYPMFGIGMIGHRAGPDVKMVDIYGLADPLIARIPALGGKDWRIGHFTRHIPAGYLETLETGQDHFVDRDLAEYDRQLRLVTAGPIFSGERWAAIWRLNTGQLDHLIDVAFYRAPRYQELPALILSHAKESGHPWEEFDTFRIPKEKGLRVTFPALEHHAALDLALANNDEYRIELERAGKVVWRKVFKVKKLKQGGLRRLELRLPDNVAAAGYDALRIFGLAKDGKFSIGHLIPVDPAEKKPDDKGDKKPDDKGDKKPDKKGDKKGETKPEEASADATDASDADADAPPPARPPGTPDAADPDADDDADDAAPPPRGGLPPR